MLRSFGDGVRHLPLYAQEGAGSAAPVVDDAADPAADAPANDNTAGAAPANDNSTAGDPPVDPAAPPPPAGHVPDWRDREIATKHRKLVEQRAEADRLRQENEALRQLAERARQAAPAPTSGQPAPQPAPQPQPGPQRGQFPTQQEFEQAVQRETSVRTEQAQFNAAAETADAKGRTDYGPAWDKARENIVNYGGFDQDTMFGILSTDNPAKVIHDLGTNPENLVRVMNLPPHKRLAELVKLSIAPAAAPKPKPLSNAPAPVEQVGGRANQGDPTELKDELEDAEWYRRRRAEKANSVGRPWSVKRSA
jgi:hypothetical protein